MKFIFRSNGNYIGFIDDNNNLFSRDGIYLGWLEKNLIWDTKGNFRGQLVEINGNNYILRNTFTIPPIPRIPKVPPVSSALPAPPINIAPIRIKIGFVDAFLN